ncbi:DUF11 domain-containing protein, partial [Algoriphagus lacus]
SVTATANYTITQADLDNGSVTNTATASGNEVTSNQDSETATANQTFDYTITKVADIQTYSAVDEEVDYTITVKNTGNVTLKGIVVTDPLTGLDETIESLAPGDESVLVTTYLITQVDLDEGFVTNTATASFGEIEKTASEIINADQNPFLDITKVADNKTYDAVGNVITYTITVTNTGNITLNEIEVSDPLTGLDELISVLSPGDSEVFETSYTISQDDIEDGQVVNTATAKVGEIEEKASEIVSAIQRASINLNKVSNVATVDAVGDVIVYTLTVTNTGNVTLSNVTVTDPKTGLNQNVGTLNPGASQAVNTQYVVTLADMN